MYGSSVLNDFRLGWSDLDILVLTSKQITEEQAKSLVGLRQAMLVDEPDNPYYRSFEGGMLTLDAFLSKKTDRVVYWGTSGAVVSLPQNLLEIGISCESGEKILSAILQYPDVFLSIEKCKGLYSNRDIPVWEPVIWDKFPTLPEDIILYKILASSQQKPLYEGIETTLTDDVYHTIANNDLIQIMSKEATKWNGIKQMLSHFGVSPSDAVYFGDDNDDIEPIKNCGLGVAVSNAIPSVLDVADRIIDSNDMDGVAKFIEENLL